MIDLKNPLSDVTEQFLKNLQGNILKGHGRSYAAHLLVSFNPHFQKTARTWLAYFANRKITSAFEQNEQTTRHKIGHGEELFCIVLLSATGYRVLDINGIDDKKIPNDKNNIFGLGMRGSVSLSGMDHADTWDVPYKEDIHAMVLLAHNDREKLKREILFVRKQLIRFCSEIYIEEGERVTNDQGQVIENFGYADGISQPLFSAQEIRKEIECKGGDKWNPEANLGSVLFKEPDSDQYGSFMVFRKLEQNIANYNLKIKKLVDELKISEKEAAAHIMGRFKNGQALISTSKLDDGVIPNNFNFDEDKDGKFCPFNAHIRKANPRGEYGAEDIRIVRRGITYGRRSLLGNVAENDKVGLLFMSFQSDITSFETIQLNAEKPNFVRDDAGIDPIVSRQNNDLVTLKGGEYFFAPSISALKELMDLTSLKFSDDEKQKAKEIVDGLLGKKAVLKEMGEFWGKHDYIGAVDVLKISATDFDAFYAYLITYIAQLDSAPDDEIWQKSPDPQSLMPKEIKDIKDINDINDVKDIKEIKDLELVFLKLLDPDTLEKFLADWEKDKDKAFKSLGLSGESDAQAIYEYLLQFKIVIPMLLWA